MSLRGPIIWVLSGLKPSGSGLRVLGLRVGLPVFGVVK